MAPGIRPHRAQHAVRSGRCVAQHTSDLFSRARVVFADGAQESVENGERERGHGGHLCEATKIVTMEDSGGPLRPGDVHSCLTRRQVAALISTPYFA